MRKIVAVGFAAIVMLACSGGGGGIGSTCTSSSGCNGADFCNQRNWCTRDCTVHSDCGCPPNTTNQDLADGKCGYSCVDLGTGTSVCAKLCANDSQCGGIATCMPAVDSNNNSLGYSDCL